MLSEANFILIKIFCGLFEHHAEEDGAKIQL